MPLPRPLRSIAHYLLLVAGTLLAVLLLLTGVVYYIAVSDQERVPAIVEEVSRETLGAEATFSHYRFQYLEHFPFLSLALEDVVLRDPCFEDHGRELLRIKKMSAVFRPWKLLQREFELRSISIDSARIQLYRSEDGYFNAAFLEENAIGAFRGQADSLSSFLLDKIKVRGVFFDFQDSQKGKRFRFELRRSDIGLSSFGNVHRLALRGKWFFYGLHFKEENGPYFQDQESRIRLNVEWGGPAGGLRLLPSVAAFGKDSLLLEGGLELGDTNHLRLAIRSPGILLEDARPLLADNVRKNLKLFSASRPAAVDIRIEGPLLPGRRQPLQVDFHMGRTVFTARHLRFTNATIRGRYVNNCDSTGPITGHSDCLNIDLLNARLFDTIAVEAHYHAENMKAPQTTVKGRLQARLVDINPYLPPGPIRFRSGEGEVAFTLSGRMDNPVDTSAIQTDVTLDGKGHIRGATLDYSPGNQPLTNVNAAFAFDGQDIALQQMSLRLGESQVQLKGKVYGLMAALFGRRAPLFASLDVYSPHLDLGAIFAATSSNDGGGAAQRKRKGGSAPLSRLEAEMRVVAGSLVYRKLKASEARFTARLLPNCTDEGASPCLSVDRFSAVIFDELPVEASLRLEELEDPVMDMELQLATPLTRLNAMLPQRKLHLLDGELGLQLHYRGRLGDYSNLDASALAGKLSGTAAITGGSADYPIRGYQFRDFNGAFHFDGRDLVADSVRFVLNGNQGRATGTLNGLIPFVLNAGDKLQADLEITTPELDLNRFSIGKPAGGKAGKEPLRPNRVAQVLEKALATVEGKLSVRAGQLHFNTLSLDEVAFDGRLLPSCRQQGVAGGCIIVENLSARIFETASFTSTLRVTNLSDPFFVADVEVEVALEELNRMFAPGQFRFSNGKIAVGFHYEGRPHGHFDVKNALLKADLKGEGHITGGAFEYKPRGYRFRDVDTRFAFDEEDLHIESIQLLLNDNEMRGRGRFIGFLPFLFLPGRELEASLEVSAGAFDFDKFKAPQKFLQPSAGRPQSPTVVTRLVNAGLENINAHLQLDIGRVKYRNFRASDITGTLTMKPGLLSFEDTRMNLCDGAFYLSGKIGGLKENRPDIDVQGKFKNTDIRQVFRSFDNFGQEELTFQNIRGRLHADVRFSARANANYDLLPASMKGAFDVKVKDGALIGLPALDSLQGFLLRRGGLSNIQFATLENYFELQGRDLLVDHFFVASTALSFGVEGRYTLGGGGDTNLLFEVPVANLFWQGKKMDALEQLHYKKRRPAILLRATEKEEGGLNFKWVLSKGK